MSTSQTEAVLAHHLQAVGAGDLSGILSDYSDDSVLHAPDVTCRGLAEIQGFFEGFADKAPAGFMDSFEMIRQVCEGDVAFIVWRSGTAAPLGTDTFVIQDGKIAIQTYAAHFA